MIDIIHKVCDCIENGRPAAFCLLVETRGSTPQKAGAGMLVFADGSQAGTLGGGCVEAEVKRRALAVLNASKAEILRFQLDNDYGWDDGLICGGRMHVLVEPLGRAENAEFFQAWCDQAVSGCTVACVFDGETSKLPETACFLFDHDSQLTHSLRAAPSDVDTVTANLAALDERPQSYAYRGVSYMPMLSRTRLLVVGGGHLGQAVGELAARLDFDVWVIDDREEYVSTERFPFAERRITGKFAEILPEIEVTADTYCLIVTRGHNHDEEALFHLLNRGARYVGMIGSKRKIKLIFEDLLEEGISQESLSNVHAPVGLDIGSQTVPEIAVSIAAELVAHRNLGGKVPGRGRHDELTAALQADLAP